LQSRKRLGAGFPFVGTNDPRTGKDAARMMLTGASAVEYCSAVMTGGFGVLGAAVAELQAYCDARGQDAASLVGLALDRVGAYADQPSEPGRWRHFVPPETLAG